MENKNVSIEELNGALVDVEAIIRSIKELATDIQNVLHIVDEESKIIRRDSVAIESMSELVAIRLNEITEKLETLTDTMEY